MPTTIGYQPESPKAIAYDLILMETDRAPHACLNIYAQISSIQMQTIQT
jgi:hypothetical protein